MSLGVQVVWLFVLSIPIACIAWTVTQEEMFRELRDFCRKRCENEPRLVAPQILLSVHLRVLLQPLSALFFLLMTRYRLLLDDRRGTVFSIVLPIELAAAAHSQSAGA
jgi:hypothetical protein